MKKKHRKGSFERHGHGYDPRQSFPQKSHRPFVSAVRDWPQGCGNFIPPTPTPTPTDSSKVIGDINVAAVSTAGNFQAPVEHSFCSSTCAEIRRQKFRSCPVEWNFSAGLIFGSSSSSSSSSSVADNNISNINEKFSAEIRPSGQEMQDYMSGASAKRSSSYEGSNEISNNFGETTGFVGKWDGDAKKVGQKIQIQDGGCSFERSGSKETGNEVQEAFDDIFGRIPSQETVNEVQISDSRDGVTSAFMGIDGETLLIFNVFSFISLIIF